MFDGIPDQFYQFLAAAASSRATPDLPLSFSLHHGGAGGSSFPTTYPSPPPLPPQLPHTSFGCSSLLPPPHLLHQAHHQFPLHLQQACGSRNINEDIKEETASPSGLSTCLQDQQRERSFVCSESIDPWSNDEVLALLRVRSSMDNAWFPDFTWENVSRKLVELGFKRSAEKCKEKFEEETRSFNSSIVNNCSSNKSNNMGNNNYRLFGELEELYNNNNNSQQGDHHHQIHPPLSPDHHDHPNPDHQSLLSQSDNQGPNNIQNEDDNEIVEEDKTEQEARNDKVRDEQSVDDSEKTEENTKRVMKKRKRQKKFEMFKGFCENIVNKMMAQQEELHCKILQDMVKRDEEKIAKEEAWKKQEIERIHKEMEFRAHEQAIVGDRQVKILDFLKKFTSNTATLESQSFLGEIIENLMMKIPNDASISSVLTQDSINNAQPISSCTTHDQNPSCNLVTHNCLDIIPTSSTNENLALQVISSSSTRVDNSRLALPMPSSSSIDQTSQNPNLVTTITEDDSFRITSVLTQKLSGCDHTSTNTANQVMAFRSIENQANLKSSVRDGHKDDTGRRWPRDEVLALINIRFSLFNNNNNGDHLQHEREVSSKGPLWERISQKMMELGYMRSAKRCKEKWENINKYFRKTKDSNKKRSTDSRTCPYFHQLSHLYNQGTLVGPSDRSENLPGSPENGPIGFSGDQAGGYSASTNGATTIAHASQGNESTEVQVPASFDFEF